MNISNRVYEALESLLAYLGAGRVFYVIPSSRAWKPQFEIDKGVQVGNVFTTLSAALGQCTADRGDVIVVEPGTYTLTAAQAVAIAGVTIMGRPGAAARTIIVGDTTASTNALNITAADVLLKDLTVKSGVASGYAVSVRAARVTIKDCIIAGNVVNADGVELQNGADDFTMQDCLLEAVTGAASALGVTLVATAAGAPDRCLIERCSFRGWTTMISDAGSAATAFGALKVRDCDGQIDAGNLPANYVKLDTVAGGTGAFESCRFATATNANTVFVLPAGVLWTANATEAGWSTARPA